MKIIRKINKKFDKEIIKFYGATDLKNGFIEITNQSENVEKIKVMRISVML